jgi:hypothetical protein
VVVDGLFNAGIRCQAVSKSRSPDETGGGRYRVACENETLSHSRPPHAGAENKRLKQSPEGPIHGGARGEEHDECHAQHVSSVVRGSYEDDPQKREHEKWRASPQESLSECRLTRVSHDEIVTARGGLSRVGWVLVATERASAPSHFAISVGACDESTNRLSNRRAS